MSIFVQPLPGMLSVFSIAVICWDICSILGLFSATN